jgi:hypothetical protein
MKKNQKKKKSKSSMVIASPEQALGRLRKRRLKRMIKELRGACQSKIRKFCGPPLDIPIDKYLPDAVNIIEMELKVFNWKVSRHSGLEGQNPIIRLSMR